MADGGADGAVITGQSAGALTAFESATGTAWRRTTAFGSVASQSVAGVTLAAGSVVTTGASTVGAGGEQPVLTMVGAQPAPVRVSLNAIPGAVEPQLGVNGVAASGSTQIAVGSANGFPAAWVSSDGGGFWKRATGASPQVLDRPGVQQLTGVTAGPSGWLAVGGVSNGSDEHPVVVTSPDGQVWSAADGEAVFAGPGLFTEQAAANRQGGPTPPCSATSKGRRATRWPAAWWSAGPACRQRATVPGGGARMLAVTGSSAGASSRWARTATPPRRGSHGTACPGAG